MRQLGTTARVFAAAGLATVALSGLGFGAATARAAPLEPLASPTSCTRGATCVTIPSPCAAGKTCPTVSAEPSSDLGQNQWIYLSLADFPYTNPVNVVQIYFCADQTALTATSPPHCILEGTSDFSYPNEEVPIMANGTGAMSFQTLDNPRGHGDIAFVGEIPGDSTARPTSFFCGDPEDRCSVDVVDPTLLPPGTANNAIPVPSDTAVIPLGFASQKPPCAAKFPFIASDYSIDQLFQHEAPVACGGKNPVIPLDTPASTTVVLSSLANGNVAFLDDPQAADVRAALAKVHYSVVPVTASAVVIGYVAAMEQDGLKYPFNSFELTPNEVAGLSVYTYQGPYDSDLVKCGTTTCSAMEGLNTVPGYIGASQYGVFPPSDDTGVTEELTDWVCNAPNVPFTLNGKLITDPNTAPETLTHSVNQTPWPIRKCTAFDTFPPLKPLGTLFDPALDPLHAVKFLRTFAIPPQFQASPVAGFAPIDWADARYNGLDTASLQNADGQFVAPTTASVQAQIAAEPVGKDGYPLPDPTLKVSGAYPMSTVIYALVPDSPLPSAQSTLNAEMMDELLDYTTTTKVLPDGYVPLPAKLATLAHSELAKALAAENAGRTSPTATTVSVTPPSTSVGTPVVYSATVTATTGVPSGSVAFKTGSIAICRATLSRGTGSCVSATAPIGDDTIRATYAGASGFAGSTATTSLSVVSSTPPTVPPTTNGGVLSTGGSGTSVPTSRPSSAPTSVPSRTTQPSKRPTRGLSVADVTLSAATARIGLPVALGLGGILIVISLGLSFVGYIRRRAESVDSA
jgi:hypothetical protein